jgi:hypothetical protein
MADSCRLEISPKNPKKAPAVFAKSTSVMMAIESKKGNRISKIWSKKKYCNVKIKCLKSDKSNSVFFSLKLYFIVNTVFIFSDKNGRQFISQNKKRSDSVLTISRA